MKNLEERSKILIEQQTTGSRKWKELEQVSGISGATWRTWWQKNKPPSGEMIEKLCAAWPQFAFWLTTGITDTVAGHIAPLLAYSSEINLNEPKKTSASVEYHCVKKRLFDALNLESRDEMIESEILHLYKMRSARLKEISAYIGTRDRGYFDPRILKLTPYFDSESEIIESNKN